MRSSRARSKAPTVRASVDVQVGPAASVVQTGTAYTGSDTQGGTEYLVHVDPIQDDQNIVVGARWYGVPMAQINDIINHITLTLLLWGFIAMILALAFGDSDRAACFRTRSVSAAIKCAMPRRNWASSSSAARFRAITSR